MAEISEELAAKLTQMEADCTKQGAIVRDLKKSKAPQDELKVAVALLQKMKAELADATPKPWDRTPFEDLLKRRFVYAPSFENYGGVAGLYDYGPIGCAIKNNLIALWRRHFILHDNIYEIDCPAMTPEVVLKASGHVQRFADIMVKDMKTGECLRADHLLEDVMEARMKDGKLTQEERAEAKLIHAQADTYDKAQLQELFAKFGFTSPAGNPLSEPEDFNMMFSTQIGPSGQLKGFLRPETAQGIFLAFKRLYEFNNSKLPFAGAQIGTSFRNEISPKAGVLRVREFQMAEIEYFLDPENKKCSKFATVADLEIPLFSQESQMTGKPPVNRRLGDAVADGMIDNETLGYFLGRIFLFIRALGTDMKRFRLRQHLKNEMAHYATDCWDVELHTSYGWIECVGCADRSAFDLEAHSKGSGIKLEAAVRLAEPITSEKTVVVPNKKTMGKALKKDAKIVTTYFESLDDEGAAAIGAELEANGEAKFTIDGKDFVLGKDVISVAVKSETMHERKFTPAVIEPSFGIGRIMYCLLEHVYDVRENDEQRGYLKLPPNMAPVKCSLLPLSAGNEEFDGPQDTLLAALTDLGVSCRVDDSSAQIGRRYARTDEIGIPFGITIDFETKDDGKVTLRERDSMGQIRLLIADVAPLVAALETGKTTWADAEVKFGVSVTGAAAANDGAGADGN